MQVVVVAVVVVAVEVVDEGEDIVEVLVVLAVVVVVSLLEDGMGSALGVMAMATGQATLLDNGHRRYRHILTHCHYHGRVYHVL